MKKGKLLASLCALFLVSAVSAFALAPKEFMLGVGIDFPINTFNASASNQEWQMKVNGFGADLLLRQIYDGGFTYEAQIGLGGASIQNEVGINNRGFDWLVDIGIGYTFFPVANKFSVSLIASFGMDLLLHGYEYSESGYKIKSLSMLYAVNIGGDITANFKFNDHWGLFSTMCFRVPFGTDNVLSMKMYENGSLIYSGSGGSDSSILLLGGFVFKPVVGISYTF